MTIYSDAGVLTALGQAPTVIFSLGAVILLESFTKTQRRTEVVSRWKRLMEHNRHLTSVYQRYEENRERAVSFKCFWQLN